MIRPARAADLPRLRAIQLVALDQPWQGLLEPSITGPATVLVTTTPDDQPVGYAVAIPQDERAYLPEFAIAVGHRREGRGSALMERLCTRLAADGFETLTLTVKADDDTARAFYDSLGFQIESELLDHYESGDGLQLVRSL